MCNFQALGENLCNFLVDLLSVVRVPARMGADLARKAIYLTNIEKSFMEDLGGDEYRGNVENGARSSRTIFL